MTSIRFCSPRAYWALGFGHFNIIYVYNGWGRTLYRNNIATLLAQAPAMCERAFQDGWDAAYMAEY